MSWTMARYFGRRFFVTILGTLLVIGAIIFVLDFAELVRRSANKDELTFPLMLLMTAQKLPMLAAKTFPFAIMFGSMLAFFRLTRHQELIVARASGVSVWQFLLPPLAVALMLGIFATTVYNPVAAALGARYEQQEAEYLKGRPSLFAMSQNGFWIRQGDGKTQSIVHALRVSDRGLKLYDVTFYTYGLGDRYLGRIDAEEAELGTDVWNMQNVWIGMAGDPPVYHDTYALPTSLTLAQVQESFAKPETISFWDLPGFINMAERAGFAAERYRMHWYALTALPVLFCTMVLVAASFSLRVARFGGVTQLVLAGITAGVLLYFLTDLSQALGETGILPPLLAAWAPSAVASFLGLAALFQLEDG